MSAAAEGDGPKVWLVIPLWTSARSDRWGTPVAAFLDEDEADAHAKALADGHAANPVGQDRQYHVEEAPLLGRGAGNAVTITPEAAGDK